MATNTLTRYGRPQDKPNPNLNLQLQTKVEKIIIENNKAIGVEFKNQKGKVLKKYVNKQKML